MSTAFRTAAVAASARPPRVPWYRVPVAWVGILVFAASVAGCVWMIVVSAQFRDDALPTTAPAVLGTPVHARPALPAS